MMEFVTHKSFAMNQAVQQRVDEVCDRTFAESDPLPEEIKAHYKELFSSWAHAKEAMAHTITNAITPRPKPKKEKYLATNNSNDPDFGFLWDATCKELKTLKATKTSLNLAIQKYKGPSPTWLLFDQVCQREHTLKEQKTALNLWFQNKNRANAEVEQIAAMLRSRIGEIVRDNYNDPDSINVNNLEAAFNVLKPLPPTNDVLVEHPEWDEPALTPEDIHEPALPPYEQ